MPDSLPEFRFHHFALSVPDLEESIAWFGAKLGFTEEWRMDNAMIPAKVAFLKRGPHRVELFEAPGAAPLPADRRDMQADPRTHGNKHVAFEVDDIRGLFDEFRRRDVDIVNVLDRPWATIGFIRDNAGNLIEFVQPK
jgi:methylmalonyl-CoA/ethylmalonyl-CoA epimerase